MTSEMTLSFKSLDDAYEGSIEFFWEYYGSELVVIYKISE